MHALVRHLSGADEATLDAPFCYLDISTWGGDVDTCIRDEALAALESGKTLCLPSLDFALGEEERHFLDPSCVDPSTKSIKYELRQDRLWGEAKDVAQKPLLQAMLRRYALSAQALVESLLPHYRGTITLGNTSFRPVEVEGRAQSRRQDDSLLHIDAFPSRPVRGERLLRIFTNVDPSGNPRRWRVGEPFPHVAEHFLPHIPKPWPGSAALLRLLRLTKTTRSPYDHYMLQLHDRMKRDAGYQRHALQAEALFPARGSWIVFTDQVPHAAMSGQHAFEQTFTLPVTAMAAPEKSPLMTLERLTGKRLL